MITYKLKFIDSLRFMSYKLTNLADNLSEIYSKKIKNENCESPCDFIGFKNNKLHYKCKACKKKMVEISKKINEKVSKCLSILQW